MELRLPGPGWGFANITGPLQAWSFTETLPVAKDPLVRALCDFQTAVVQIAAS